MTVEAIVEATTRILEEDGLAGLTTNRVARRAGISIGSLYQYFPNREALIEVVRRRFNERFESRLLRLLGRLSTLGLRAALREWVVTLVELHAESPGVHHAIGTGTPSSAQAALASVVSSYLDARAIDVRRPDHVLAARVLLDAGEALIHNTSLRAPELLEDPAWVDEVCDLLQRYIASDQTPARRRSRVRGAPAQAAPRPSSTR